MESALVVDKPECNQFVVDCHARLLNDPKLVRLLSEMNIDMDVVKSNKIGRTKQSRDVITIPNYDINNVCISVNRIQLVDLSHYLKNTNEKDKLSIDDWIDKVNEILPPDKVSFAPAPLDIDGYLTVSRPTVINIWGNGILHRQSIAILGAQAKAQKTYFALNWAYNLAYEKEFLGIEIFYNCITMYFDYEVGELFLPERIKAIAKDRSRQGNGKFVPITLRGFKIDTPEGKKVFELYFEVVKPDVVFVDTLSNYFASDENSATGMKAAFDILLEWTMKYNIAFVLIHHTRKNTTNSPIHDLRGSTVISATGTTLLGLSIKDNYRIIDSELRNGPPLEKIWVKMDENRRFQVVDNVDDLSINHHKMIVDYLINQSQPIPQKDLKNALMTLYGDQLDTWRKRIGEAVSRGLIQEIKDGKNKLYQSISIDGESTDNIK